MNETIDSSAENFSPAGQTGEAANAMRSWKENLKDNFFIVLLVSIRMSFLVGYFICQQQEAEKREQWAEVFSGRPGTGWLNAAGRPQARRGRV